MGPIMERGFARQEEGMSGGVVGSGLIDWEVGPGGWMCEGGGLARPAGGGDGERVRVSTLCSAINEVAKIPPYNRFEEER